MRLEHLTNKSATNLLGELSSVLMKAAAFSIASAFINDEAIELIAASLKKNKKLQGRILIGLYNFFNKKKDLEALLQLVQNNPARLQVHISLDQCFHWKYYHFISGQKQTFYIGSANFTTSGMADNRELVIKLSDSIKTADRSLQNLAKSFEKEWLHSRPLTEFPLQHYKEAERPKSPSGAGNKEINDFFNQKDSTKLIRAGNGKTYAVGLYTDASPATYKAIENQKGEWVKSGWDWFVLPTRRLHDTCAQCSSVFVFSKEGKDKVYCRYSDIVDDDPNIVTPDGNYFIAHKPVKCIKLTRKHREALREPPLGIDLIGWKEPFYNRALRKAQVAAIKELLGINNI
jgi:HKD family nuclease